MNLIDFETSCLSSKNNTKSIVQDASEALQCVLRPLLDQEYLECLKKCLEINNFLESTLILKDNVHKISTGTIGICGIKNDVERILWWFSCGVSCLQLFVQINWTGPSTNSIEISNQTISTEALDHLSEDGQAVYHLVKFPHLLLAAKLIFSALLDQSVFQTVAWWLFRCHCVHSQILLDHSESLFTCTKKSMQIAMSSSIFQDLNYKSLLFQFHLECGLSLLHYYSYKEADKEFESARKLSGIEFGFTGALGVRTKFQVKPVSQLLVKVKRTSNEPLRSLTSSKQNLPSNFSLDDEVLLNKVKLVDENDIDNPVLSPEEYCMILSACTAMQKTNPAHRIKQEKVEAVLEFLLSSPSCWCVHTEALRLRCLNERDRSRTVERSMKQLDELVRLVSVPHSPHLHRLDLFYAVRPPPVWVLQKDLAKLFISLGSLSSALQIYERLEMWEDAILCLIRTDRASEAMRIIKEQLEVNESANLWCLLGDIKQEPDHYLKAWQLSKQRSNRAMTSLGCYYVSRKEYEKGVECFEKSLGVLSLQVGTWFTMGCTLLQMGSYLKAADAFRRCVGLDWDNYEAWTNLSVAYVRCGKKEQGYKALSEAIKCNFDRWQLWENFVAISTETGHFNDAISAYSRLLDLKRKFVDVPVLNALVRTVTENIPDYNGREGKFYKSKLLSLFGHVTSQTTGDSLIWELYARLCGDGVGSEDTENEKALQLLHKCVRTGMQKSSWEKDEKEIKRLVEICCKLTQGCSHCRAILQFQFVSSVRLTINGFMSKLKQREQSLIEVSAQENIRNFINEVDPFLESLNQILSELKRS